MPFIECNKSREDLLRGLHQDTFINIFSVHDETVQSLDKRLAQPIMTRMIQMAELDKIFSQVDLPFIKFKFDVEYDKFGSYTASQAFDVYEYAMESYKIMRGYNKDTDSSPDAKEDNNKNEVLEEPTIHTLKYDSVESFQKEMPQIDALPDGDTILVVIIQSIPFTYKRLVSIN